MPEDNVFEQVNELAKDSGENIEIEPAFYVDKSNNTVTPGITIHSGDFNAPLFFSVDELDRMAAKAKADLIKRMEQE